MGTTIGISDFSSISKRATELTGHVLSKASEPGSFVTVDSTGLKVYGKDERHQERHGVPARRAWHKLHLAVDENHNLSGRYLTKSQSDIDATAAKLLLGI